MFFFEFDFDVVIFECLGFSKSQFFLQFFFQDMFSKCHNIKNPSFFYNYNMKRKLTIPDHMKPMTTKRVSVRVRPPMKCAPCGICACLCRDDFCQCCDNSCVVPVRFYYSK